MIRIANLLFPDLPIIGYDNCADMLYSVRRQDGNKSEPVHQKSSFPERLGSLYYGKQAMSSILRLLLLLCCLRIFGTKGKRTDYLLAAGCFFCYSLDGNGRVSRLLIFRLLPQEGFEIGKYISIDKKYQRISLRLLSGAEGMRRRMAAGEGFYPGRPGRGNNICCTGGKARSGTRVDAKNQGFGPHGMQMSLFRHTRNQICRGIKELAGKWSMKNT